MLTRRQLLRSAGAATAAAIGSSAFPFAWAAPVRGPVSKTGKVLVYTRSQGFEHSVVNMFVVPSAMMLGAGISIGQWLFWNLLPVTLGNLIAGALFTGAALYLTYPGEAALSTRAQSGISIQSDHPAPLVEAAGAQPM